MQKGYLRRWNDEKGFGFIDAENVDEDVFLHISAVQGAERRPAVGDIVYFRVEIDENGRKKAVSATIEGVKSVFGELKLAKTDPRYQHSKAKAPKHDVYRSRQYQPRKSGNRFASSILTILAVSAAAFAVSKFNQTNLHSSLETTNAQITSLTVSEKPRIESQFKCEGKTRCNQMTSCSEAMFYLNNCPGSVTDGDGDGRPCEDQWCGH